MTTPHSLPRKLTLLDSTMINVGSMIGSGIFIVPATIAMYLHSSIPIFAVWIVGGIVSLFGALSVAELGAMMPEGWSPEGTPSAKGGGPAQKK